MIKTYEYLLADLGNYKEVVHEHRREGWRLMRIAVPEVGAGKDWRLIFEREGGKVTSAASDPFGRRGSHTHRSP
jgi:hypothetical protein